MAFNRLLPFETLYNQRVVSPGHVAPEPSILSPLLCEEFEDASGAMAVRYGTDSMLIFHQKDLENRLGADQVRRLLKSLNSASYPFSEVQSAMDKLSDSDLFRLIRPRHLQAPSEIKRYEEEIVCSAMDLVQARDQLLAERREAAAAAAAAAAADSAGSSGSETSGE